MAGAKSAEKVNFKTEDGFRIYGNLTRGGKKAILLMHQFQLDKSSYDDFARKLADANFTVLAIDLRGHGESLEQNGVKRRFADFKESDFRSMELDAGAAKQFLAKEGYTLYGVVGSSIGANTALNYSAQDSAVEKVVLLSPGINFKGIEIEGRALGVRAKTLCIATPADSYSYSTCKALKNEVRDFEFLEIRGTSHGTYMFGASNLEGELVKWFLQ